MRQEIERKELRLLYVSCDLGRLGYSKEKFAQAFLQVCGVKVEIIKRTEA